MRRIAIAVLLPLALGVLVAGCGGDSSAGEQTTATAITVAAPPPAPAPKPKPWRTFRKAELPKMALQPRDAPADLRYVRAESGRRSLGDIYALQRQQREARSFGFLGAYDAVFAAKAATSDRRVAERTWLFRTRRGASGWLKKTKRSSAELEFQELAAPLLGDESWAAMGVIQIGGGRAITHTFRLGNAVFVVTMYGDQSPPSEAGALAAARAALARAKSA